MFVGPFGLELVSFLQERNISLGQQEVKNNRNKKKQKLLWLDIRYLYACSIA
jgi:hypothetical protein